MSAPEHPALEAVQFLQRAIRDHVLEAFEKNPGDTLSDVAEEGEGDTIYAVDRVGEDALIDALEPRSAALGGVVLVAEGLSGGRCALPRGTSEDSCRYRMLVDPIDGTRGLMYQKRSAWVLTGVAPNRGAATRSTQIELAVQTEIPISKQRASDELYAVRGRGAYAERVRLDTGERRGFDLSPSRATTIAHGFASFVSFIPGGRSELAALDDAMVEALLGPPVPGKAQSFADQYPSTGGQLYELMVGHDRFVGDLRPLVAQRLNTLGRPFGACCHPYDLAASLIAEEAGVLVTDPSGRPLDFPLDLEANVAWLGYANAGLRARIEPVLSRLLREHHLM